MKIELHLHSLGGSPCAKADADEIVKVYKKEGYDVLVLTNHISTTSYGYYPKETDEEKAEYFLSLYHKLKAAAEKENITVLLGAEVRVKDPEDYFSEYLLYGITEDFIKRNPPLCTFTQRELFKLADENGFLMVQSHPFRKGVKVGYYAYLHGAEVYNGHKSHEEHNEVSKAFAKSFSLIETSGTDYHEQAHYPDGGIVTDKKVKTNEDLLAVLRSGNYKLIEDGKVLI